MIYPKYQKINSLYKREDNGKFTSEFSDPIFDDLYYAQWEGREKIDGMNIRICWDGYQLDFRGKTDKAILPEPMRKYLKEHFPIDFLSSVFPNLEHDEAVVLW